MLLEDLIDIVEAYGDLGQPVQEQLTAVIGGWEHDCLEETLEEQNANALLMIRDWFRGANHSLEGDAANEIAVAIDRYLDGTSDDEEEEEE